MHTCSTTLSTENQVDGDCLGTSNIKNALQRAFFVLQMEIGLFWSRYLVWDLQALRAHVQRLWSTDTQLPNISCVACGFRGGKIIHKWKPL